MPHEDDDELLLVLLDDEELLELLDDEELDDDELLLLELLDDELLLELLDDELLLLLIELLDDELSLLELLEDVGKSPEESGARTDCNWKVDPSLNSAKLEPPQPGMVTMRSDNAV